MGTLTATGRTGQDIANAIMEGRFALEDTPCGYRAALAEIALGRWADEETMSCEEKLLLEIIKQGLRDIGKDNQDDSWMSWRHGDFNVFLDLFGIDHKAWASILDGLKLWKRKDVYRACRPKVAKWSRVAGAAGATVDTDQGKRAKIKDFAELRARFAERTREIKRLTL